MNTRIPSAGSLQTTSFHCPSALNEFLSLEHVGDYFPGIVVLQDLFTGALLYLNKSATDFLGLKSNEVRLLGTDYFRKCFNITDLQTVESLILNFVTIGDYSKTCSFFIRARPNSLADFSYFFTSVRLYPSKSNAQPSLLLYNAVGFESMPHIENIDSISRNNKFIPSSDSCEGVATNLSIREKEIIRLIGAGKSSYEISRELFISIHTVNNHRKNIIRKLNLKGLPELIHCAMTLQSA